MSRRETLLFIGWIVCVAILLMTLASAPLAGGIELFLEYVNLIGRL